MKKTACALAAALMLSGCAGPSYDNTPYWASGVVIDTDSYSQDDLNRYNRDLIQCQRIAERAHGAGSGAAGGAVAGALFGAALGLLIGDAGEFALQGAGIGAASGAASGAGAGAANRVSVYRNCLRGRGHSVLN